MKIAPKKILVIRFSSIGDLVLTSPVYRCLKLKYPDAVVHLVVKSKLSNVLENNPYIDKIIVLEGSLFSLIKTLRNESYDYVIDLHNNLRSNLIKLGLNVASSSVRKMNWAKWKMVFLKNKITIPHIVDRYMNACAAIGVSYDGKGLDHYTDDQSKSWHEQHFLAKYSNNAYVVFAVGGQFDTKRLPLSKWMSLASKCDLQIHVIGGKEDKNIGEELHRFFPEKIVDWTGTLSINQSAELIKTANKVYTNDTGMMHIAAAYSKDIDVFWGNTVPEFGMSPFYPDYSFSVSTNLQVMGLGCRPCSKIGFKACPKGHFDCMNLQKI